MVEKKGVLSAGRGGGRGESSVRHLCFFVPRGKGKRKKKGGKEDIRGEGKEVTTNNIPTFILDNEEREGVLGRRHLLITYANQLRMLRKEKKNRGVLKERSENGRTISYLSTSDVLRRSKKRGRGKGGYGGYYLGKKEKGGRELNFCYLLSEGEMAREGPWRKKRATFVRVSSLPSGEGRKEDSRGGEGGIMNGHVR